MSTCRIAAIQVYHGPDSTPEGNRDRIVWWMGEAAAAGAKLALFPELSLSGYTTDERDIPARAAATTPALIGSVADAARRLGVAVVVGVLEAAPTPGKAYNASLAIGSDGAVTRYRKIHICPNEPYEPSSEGPVVADLGFIRLGLSVCYDNWFPETTRMAFLGGAELLHVPFWWPAEWERRDDLVRKQVTGDDGAVLAARRKRMMKVFPGRALDNSLYLVLVDHGGTSSDVSRHMPGKSMVIDPYGDLLAETRGWAEELLCFDFDRERVTEWRHNRFFPGSELRAGVYRRAYAAWEEQRGAGSAAGDRPLP